MTNKVFLFFLCTCLSVRAGESFRDGFTSEDVRMLAAGIKRARELQASTIDDEVGKVTEDEEREKVVSDKEVSDGLPRAAWLPEDYELVAAAAKRACQMRPSVTDDGVGKAIEAEQREQVLARQREARRRYYELHRVEMNKKNRRYRERHREEEKARHARYREEHVEIAKERERTYRAENKELLQERYRRYREQHREERREQSRMYRELHKEEIKERRRKYRAANREKERERARWYRERVKMSRLDAAANKDDGSGE